jgi:rhodanese-related sulfurtransferase
MNQPGAMIPGIDVTETAARLDGGGPDTPLLLDVREPDELRAARVEGAVHLPISVFPQRYPELPRDRQILVICASGNRSAAVTAFLLRNGWTDIHNVEGGITAWRRSGFAVKSGPIEPGEGVL